MTIPSAAAQLDFLRDLQRLLDEGGFVATYKYALLMALADLSVEQGDNSGNELPILVTDIAEKFIQYYWRQALPYPGASERAVLYQNSGRQAAVINTIITAHPKYRQSLARARQDAGEWRRLVKRVAATVKTMPLWKLQVIGRKPHCFLYPHHLSGDSIHLKRGVAYCLRFFHPMIVRMLQGAWVEEVRRLKNNQPILGHGKDLAEFLFGSEREPLTAYQPILRELQDGYCFYCGHRIRNTGAVDHFIPWVRYPVDLGHNFVLAHPKCNSQKSDHLAGPEHLEHWAARNRNDGLWLSQRFDTRGLFHHLDASIEIARWCYAQTESAGGLAWIAGRNVSSLTASWRQVL